MLGFNNNQIGDVQGSIASHNAFFNYNIYLTNEQTLKVVQRIQSLKSVRDSAPKPTEPIDKTKSLPIPPSPLVWSPSPDKVGSVPKPPIANPVEFAVAFTDLERKKFNNITLSDCIRWLTNVASPNGVSRFISENEKLSYWIQKYILFLPKHSERSGNLMYFFCVAEECEKLGNFSTAHAIFAGIASSSITGLKRTCALDRQKRKKLQNYKDMESQSDDFGAYRGKLKKFRAPCIPLLSVHMNDLWLIHGRELTFMKLDGHRGVRPYQGVNDDVYGKVLDYQRGLLGLPSSHRHSEICKFIEDGLGSFVVDEAFHEWLQHRSAQLAEEEQANYASYSDELRKAGFL